MSRGGKRISSWLLYTPCPPQEGGTKREKEEGRSHSTYIHSSKDGGGKKRKTI